MVSDLRTVGKQTGHFVHNGEGAQVFFGPFESDEEAKKFIDKMEDQRKK
jgi:hypothetical protein